MKKIITLALAAVMTLGLTVLPQAQDTPEEAYKKGEEAVQTAKDNLEKAEKKLKEVEADDTKTNKDVKDAKDEVAKCKKLSKKLRLLSLNWNTHMLQSKTREQARHWLK